MLDLSFPVGISVLIGGVECQPNIVGGSALEWSVRDLDQPEPIVQIGELTLALPDRAGLSDLSLNPLTSSMLAVGTLVQLYWGGSLKAAARIKQVEIAEFFPCTLTPSKVKLSLTDKLDMALAVESKSTPPVEPTDSVSVSVTSSIGFTGWYSRVAALISNVKDANGDRFFQKSAIVTAELSATLPERDFNGRPLVDGFSAAGAGEPSLVARAARIAALRGYYLFCDEHEQVRFIRNPTSLRYPDPVIRLDCGSVEALPSASLFEETAAAVEATTSILKVVTAQVDRIEWPQVINTIGPIPQFLPDNTILPVNVSTGQAVLPLAAGTIGVIEREVRDRPVISNSSWLQVTRLDRRKHLVNPELKKTQLVTVQRTTVKKQFRNNYLERITETSTEARTMQDVKIFPDDFGLTNGSNRIIEYELKTREVDDEEKTYFDRSVERTLTRKYKKVGKVTTSNLMEERLISEWEELGRNAWRGRKRRYVSRGLTNASFDYSLIPDPNFSAQEEFAEAPPEPPVREPEEEVRLVSKTTIISLGRAGKTKYLFLSGLESQASLDRFAENTLLAEQQYRIQVEVTRQVYPNDTALPFAREDIAHYALIRDGVRIEWNDNALAYKYTGYPFAKLPAPVSPIYPPPYNFALPPTGLTVGPYSPIQTTPGAQAVPLPLVAYGGVGPYSFSVIGAPGAGVYVSGNTLIVSGLASGNYSFALAVTDSIGTVASTTITVAVVADSASILYTLPIVAIIDRNGSKDTATIKGVFEALADKTGVRDKAAAIEALALVTDRLGTQDRFRVLFVGSYNVVAGPDDVFAGPDLVVLP